MALNRMKELVDKLNAAAYAYYQQDQSIISDFEYDRLMDELEALEQQTGVTMSQSPTGRVGYQVMSQLVKVTHESPMLSLDKTKSVDKLVEFLGDETGLLSWKLDGLTIALSYRNGELFQAVTRGNGQIGEDVTHNARTFANVPLKIPVKEEVTLRGEAVISYSNFDRINQEITDGNVYKNPRNLCSGSVRQLNSEIAAKRSVRFFAFSLISGPNLPDSKNERLNLLNNWGFETVETAAVTKNCLSQAVDDFGSRVEDFNFATDGLVLTFDNVSLSESLGTTSKFPKDSMAFKWKDETARTVLTDMIWNTSRTGLINPIAQFEPVDIEGTTISRASVHNVSIVEGLELGLGDEISVYKANMIIPQIGENFTRSGDIKPPERCPVCDEPTHLMDENGVKSLYCLNHLCPARSLGRFVHFVSRDAMNIDGLSQQTLEKFLDKGFINQYADIYRLERFRDEIVNMAGFGEKSFQKLMDSVQKSRDCKLYQLIFALGIPHVGLSGAKLLCAEFDDDIQLIMDADANRLSEISGFGDIIGASVAGYFSENQNVETVNELLTYLRIEKAQVKTAELAGLVFVITGDLNKFANRAELTALIESAGGKVSSSVSAKTSYLINNDVNSNSSKNAKAKSLNVPIISEEDFVNLFKIESQTN